MKKLLLGISVSLLAALVVSGWRAATATRVSPAQRDGKMAVTTLAADLPLQEMTRQADVIVTGQCLETRSQWIGRQLVTLATVTVGESIKGAPPDSLTVVLPGGIDANRRIPVAMTYAGAPQIVPEEEVFLFLAHNEELANGYTVMGFSQGKFSIVEDDRGQKQVSRDLSKVRLQREPGVARGQAQITPLSEFKEKVKRYLR